MKKIKYDPNKDENMDRFDDSFFEFKIKKSRILDELWDITQNFLDNKSNFDMECKDELELLKELENTDEFRKLLYELDSTKIQLNQLYIDFIDERCEGKLKKDKIIALKEKFREGIGFG